MSDIVERLRDWAKSEGGMPYRVADLQEAADEIERLREFKAQDVVHSAPQPTTEGFSMADQDQTDFAAELANLVSAALQACIDAEEIKAVLTETLEELEAEAGDEEEPPAENGEGENA